MTTADGMVEAKLFGSTSNETEETASYPQRRQDEMKDVQIEFEHSIKGKE